MSLAHRFTIVTRWIGLLLGVFVCSLPLVATAVEFKAPRRGIPGRREGAGTRGPATCVEGAPAQLTALVPTTNLGLTTAEYPRFFWYMPKSQAKLAEFALYETDENQDDKDPVYVTTFSVSGAPSVASLTLPANATIPPLVVGKDYHWSVSIICNPDDRKRDVRVDAWVQRVNPDAALQEKLAKVATNDRVLLYADNGLWFDTLTTLADLRCANPKDASLLASWVALLKSVKLDAIAEQPSNQRCGN